MNVNRAGKQQKAYWRSASKHGAKWEAEPFSHPADTQYLKSKERAQGFAAGWIAGVRWAKRNHK